MSNMWINNEQYPTKVSAEFGTEELARRAIASLSNRAGFDSRQVQLIVPPDPDLEKKLGFENRAIGSMITASQLLLVVGWLLLGLALAWLLVNFGPTAMRASPLITYITMMLLCPAIGLLLAGAISLRPEPEQPLHQAILASGSGKWTVIVRCANHEQRDRARLALNVYGR